MKKLSILFITVFFSLYSYAKTSAHPQKDSLMMLDDSLITLDEIPEWILKNIRFPQEAYQYKVAGIEQLCLSASWDGKVFISSKLNTLNPAFEKAIIEVVSKAPKCQFTGSEPKDIYKYMLIDFYKYIPENQQEHVQRITMHTPPRLANIHAGPFASKEKFTEWIHSHIRIPATLANYTDTLSFQYAITEKGKVNNIAVKPCKNELVKNVLVRTLEKSPTWKPAIADGSFPIHVTLSDKIIISTDSKGQLIPFKPYIDNVFCNSNSSPEDPNMLVLNPEIKPIYQGESNFSKDIMQQLATDRKINLNGSFIIEKDGTVSHINVQQEWDAQTDSIVKQAIAQTKWTAATQGGNKVRTIHTFGLTKGPLKKSTRNYSYYDIFGKYFIALQADPTRTRYGFIQKDGSIHQYPFNNQGAFDYASYHQGLMYYYKNTSRKQANISKEYFDRLYRMYVK